MNLIQRIINKIQRPEDINIVWGLGLPISLMIISFLTRPLGVSMVTALRDEDLATPSILALLWGGIIASLPILWLIVQFVGNANARHAEEERQPPLLFTDLLKLTESRTAPLWTVSAIGFIVIVLLDTLALIVGSEQESLILGLDRLGDATTATWLGTVLYFLVILPLMEELLFRGLLYPVLVQRMNHNLPAIGLTTLLFIGYYFLQVVDGALGWPVIYAGVIFPLVLGLTTGLVRAHTQSTLSAIGVHVAFNLFLILKAVLIFA